MYQRNYILGLNGDRSLLLEVLQMHGHRIAEVYVPQEAYEAVRRSDGTFHQRYKNPDIQKPDTFLEHDHFIAEMFGVRLLLCSLSEDLHDLPSSDRYVVLDYRHFPDKQQVISGLTRIILPLSPVHGILRK